MISVMSCITLLTGLVISPWRINISASEALGLWRLVPISTPLKRGERIVFCAPTKTISLHHSCYPKLIKTIIGIPGDQVSRDSHGLTINGQAIIQSAIDPRYEASLKLGEVFLIPPHNYWVYGSHQPKESWDSRYFGLVSEKSIESRAQPIWIWP